MEKKLEEIQLEMPKMSAAEFLTLFKEESRPFVTSGIYECLKRDWRLTELNILALTRQNRRQNR